MVNMCVPAQSGEQTQAMCFKPVAVATPAWANAVTIIHDEPAAQDADAKIFPAGQGSVNVQVHVERSPENTRAGEARKSAACRLLQAGDLNR